MSVSMKLITSSLKENGCALDCNVPLYDDLSLITPDIVLWIKLYRYCSLLLFYLFLASGGLTLLQMR